MNVRHILGISGGKDSAALFIGNPSVVFLLHAFFVGSLCLFPRNSVPPEDQYIGQTAC